MSSVRASLLVVSMIGWVVFSAPTLVADSLRPVPATDATAPAWSPDGRAIAYVNRRADHWELVSQSVDGNVIDQLTHQVGKAGSPAFSPDGRRIAFTLEIETNRDLYVIDATGSNLTRLTRDPAGEARPSWSPDGTHLVFNSDRDAGGREIFVMPVDGSLEDEPRQLTDASGHSDWAWWSPQGELIYFESNRTGTWEIFSVRPDGRGVKQITVGGGGAPVLSPDGKWLVGQARRDGNWEILRWQPDGQEEQILTKHPASDRLPAWSPSGRRIAFVSDREGPVEIYLMAADGSNIRRLTHQPENAISVLGVLRSEGLDAARSAFHRLRPDFPAQAIVDERILNNIGYTHLSADRVEDALAAFELNTVAYPESFNVWDSLGEAQAAAGQTAEALLSYERSLALNPANDNAVDKLSQLHGAAQAQKLLAEPSKKNAKDEH